MKKKITNKRKIEILDFLKESYFPNFTRVDSSTIVKRNEMILSCLTIDESRDQTSFQIVRHFHFLVSDADSIRLNVAYRATSRKGRIPRIINFSSEHSLEDIARKFEEDIDSFAILKNDVLLLKNVLLDFDNYFYDKDRCDAQYQAKLYLNWLLTLARIMNPTDFLNTLESQKSKLSLWPETAFRRWETYDKWSQQLTELLEDTLKTDIMISSSIKKLSIENIDNYEIN